MAYSVSAGKTEKIKEGETTEQILLEVLENICWK